MSASTTTIFGQRMPAFEEAQAGSTAHLMNAPRDSSLAQEEALLTNLVRNAHALYESNPEEKRRVTQDALTDTLPHKLRRWGVLSGASSDSKVALDDDVLASDVLMYTPATASMTSGVQFMPHNNVGANALEQAVVDRTSAEDMLEAHSRADAHERDNSVHRRRQQQHYRRGGYARSSRSTVVVRTSRSTRSSTTTRWATTARR